ncbi:MAG: glycosyltransferase [Chromatiaceae bacterium]|nr:MAG: glycosyltransferase [Chromatiaceae bacterium]
MRIALMVSGFDGGGVERTLSQLAAGLGGLGAAVDLWVDAPAHPFTQGLGAGVQVHDLRSPPARDPQSHRIATLVAYLQRVRPHVLMTGKLRDDRTALAARAGSGAGTRLVTTVGTPLSASLRANHLNPWRRHRARQRIRADYAQLDGISAVSAAVAADLRRHFGVTEVPLRVMCNPVVPAGIAAAAAAPCPHPWLAAGAPPAIIAVGGLRRVKDFPTLLRAFARLSPAFGGRLLILGEGRQRLRLERLVRRLGLAGRVALPGFIAAPLPWIARARLLVLTSRREGLGNVLIEAMALGRPVVATDCPGGVRDLLADGRLGPLVPVGDTAALARAMAAVLAAPPASTALIAAVAPYEIETAARAYLDFFTSLAESELDGSQASASLVSVAIG